jgi:hypothetical protein
MFSEFWTAGMAQDTFSHYLGWNTHTVLEKWVPPSDYVLFNFSPLTADNLSELIAPCFHDWLAHPN